MKEEDSEEFDSKIEDYLSNYIRESDHLHTRYGKTIRISEVNHEHIFQIISVIGKGYANMYDYVDNVLSEHLYKHHKEIKYLFNKDKLY